jgi:diguanylate cyclase (GGDEF)-like protein
MPNQIAFERAQKLREGIKGLQVNTTNMYSVGATCSFGLAGFPEHAKNSSELLHAAGEALKHAKHSGRDQVFIAA